MTPAIVHDGRLFGRFNLVDAAAIGFVVILIPIAYASYLLFRAPAPTITSVEPAPLSSTEDRVAQGSTLLGKLKVRGTGLRPVFTARIGGQPALAYIFENPASADVLYGELPPGQHDLVLLDGVQEVARAANAVTIAERPSTGATRALVHGTLLDLDAAEANAMVPGRQFPPTGEAEARLAAVGPVEPARRVLGTTIALPIDGRFERRAAIEMTCEILPAQPHECRRAGVVLSPGVTMVVPGAGSGLRFTIDEVLPAAPPTAMQVRVRFVADAQVLAALAVGDVETGGAAIPSRTARLEQLGARQVGTGSMAVELSQDRAPVFAHFEAPATMGTIEAVLSLGVDPSGTGWRHRTQSLRIGGPFSFATDRYVVRGVILGVTPRTTP